MASKAMWEVDPETRSKVRYTRHLRALKPPVGLSLFLPSALPSLANTSL